MYLHSSCYPFQCSTCPLIIWGTISQEIWQRYLKFTWNSTLMKSSTSSWDSKSIYGVEAAPFGSYGSLVKDLGCMVREARKVRLSLTGYLSCCTSGVRRCGACNTHHRTYSAAVDRTTRGRVDDNHMGSWWSGLWTAYYLHKLFA